MKKINLEQGSAEWLAYRQNQFNASEAGAVIGVNPWAPKNPSDLFDYKTGVKEVKENFAMRRGTALEGFTLDAINQSRNLDAEPAVYSSGRYSASLDGITSDEQTIIEIKNPINTEKYEWFDLANKRESMLEHCPHYYWQIVHQFYVVKTAQTAIFVIADGGEIILEACLTRDMVAGDFDALVGAWEQFGQFLDKGEKPPKGLDYVTPEWIEVAEQYKAAVLIAEEAKSQVETLKERLIKFGKKHAHNIKVAETTRKGAVNYAAKEVKEALAHLDLEQYRKKSSTFYTVKMES